MTTTLLSLSCKRIINDCIEKIIQPLIDFKISKNVDEEKNDINVIRTNIDNTKENDDNEEENEDYENNEEEDEKTEKLIIKNNNLKERRKKAENCILVIDNETSKVLSSFLSFSDLLNTGLFSIENISKKRMPFPKSKVIYMIYPTQENCNKILQDFINNKKPLYNKINIYFMESIEENKLDILVNENIINRIKKCYDLNLSYFIYDKNIFTFGYKIGSNLHILKAPKEYTHKKLCEISIKLFTVCSVINFFPNIIFQINSNASKWVAIEVNRRLQNLYKNKKIKKKGILLITDRTLDPISPAIHNYSYSSLIYDLLEKNIKTEENNKDNFNIINMDNLKGKLDYKDSLWNYYKDLHIAEIIEKLPNDFEEFKSSDIGKIGDKNNIHSSNKMEFEIKNISNYQNKIKLFGLHLRMATEVNNLFKSKNYQEIIEHEQDILTGEDKNGNELLFEELYEKFINIKAKIKMNDNDIIRVLMIYLYSFVMNEIDFNNLLGNLNENKRKIFNGLQLLGLELSNNLNNKPYKRNTLENNSINDMKTEYIDIRAKNRIISVLEDCTSNNLNEEEFGFVENPENIKYRKKGKSMNIKIKNKFEEVSPENELDNLNDEIKGELSQILIYFNIGGLSINEISLIRNLNKKKELGFKIILGSTGIYSSNQYMKELISLFENQNNEEINEINEDEDEEEFEEEKDKLIKKENKDINIEISNNIRLNNEENNIIENKEKKQNKKKKKEKEKGKEKRDNKKNKKEKDGKKKDKNKKK